MTLDPDVLVWLREPMRESVVTFKQALDQARCSSDNAFAWLRA